MKHLLYCVVLLFALTAHAQTGSDSIKIAHLKTQLSGAEGRKKVDLLNEIAWEYGWAALKDKSPATQYATQALDLANRLNYPKGKGFALITISWTKLDEDCDSLINEALSIGEEEKDYRLLGRVFQRRWDMKKAFEYFRKAGDIEGEAEAATWLCNEYAGKGIYDSDFQYCQRAIELAGRPKQSTPTYAAFISSLAFSTMADLFRKVGDYESARQYLEEAERYSPDDVVIPYAELYKQMGKPDSSLLFYEKALQKNPANGKLARQVGTANFLAGNYRRAIELLEKHVKGISNPTFQYQLPVNWKGSAHLELALSYQALNNRKLAKQHFNAALKYQRPDFLKIMNSSDPSVTNYQKASELMDIAYGLSKSFYGLNQNDSAYQYLEKYIEYKDQVNNINTISRLGMQLSNYKKTLEQEKKTSLLKLLNKDNQLKEAKLKQETLVKNGLAIGIAALLLLGVFFFRMLSLKRKTEQMAFETAIHAERQRQADLVRRSAELEMRALRAQMNPHFIFNCLSSINRFILKNETKPASNYLTRFSRLMRMTLMNSQKAHITLEDELQMLRLYLEMERLRFKNSFDYSISFLNEMDIDNIFIPPMLLQPFCENAIWHGLMHRSGQGKLEIAFSLIDAVLNCTITDNGVGRAKAEQLKTKTAEKEKSMGLEITRERLALMNDENNRGSCYVIEDLEDEHGEASGTKVTLHIRIREEIKETISL